MGVVYVFVGVFYVNCDDDEKLRERIDEIKQESWICKDGELLHDDGTEKDYNYTECLQNILQIAREMQIDIDGTIMVIDDCGGCTKLVVKASQLTVYRPTSWLISNDE